MKTIFIPIYNGIRARNFFRSSAYTELAGDPSLQLVILIPPSKLGYYRSEFPEPNVIFEPHEIISEPWFGRFLAEFAFNLLSTKTMEYKQRLEYLRYGNWPRFVLKRAVHYFLGPFIFFRSLVRFFDRWVALDPAVASLLKKYKPDLVIVPDIVFPPDRVVLRAAKRLGFRVLGMIRSWDNLTSKGVIQILPDKLIVYTSVMKQEAIKYAGMSAQDIILTGVPHYDDFFEAPRISRTEFLQGLGIDPSRRVILCAPFFDKYTGSAVVIINTLLEAIETGDLPKDVHILVRYRPATPEIPPGLIRPSSHLTISKPCSRYFEVRNIQSPTLDWEFTRDDLDLLMNSLRFSDVVINTISTLSIDAAILDHPVIVVRFDADPHCPPKHSVNLVIQHDHYRAIEKSGGVRLVWNMEELLQSLNAYLKNPAQDRAGRRKIVEEQIEFTDGRSGMRVAEYIKSMV